MVAGKPLIEMEVGIKLGELEETISPTFTVLLPFGPKVSQSLDTTAEIVPLVTDSTCKF